MKKTQAQKVRDAAKRNRRETMRQCLVNLDRDNIANPTMMAVILMSIRGAA